MRRVLFECTHFKWIDLSHPSLEELHQVQTEFDLHPVFVQDTQDPVHLPKFEKLGNLTFLLFRLYDIKGDQEAETIMSLTRKVGLFFNGHFVISVHRMSPEEFQEFFDKTLTEANLSKNLSEVSLNILLTRFLERAIRTYYRFLEKTEDELDLLEERVISADTPSDLFPHLNFLRRRLSLTKRILIHTQEVFLRLSPPSESLSPVFQDLKDTVSNLLFLSDELLEDAQALTSLQMSLSAQKNNEVMKVLTVFSVFFMPLTFIVGIYGMNFEKMPELSQPYGYAAVWGLMIVVTTGIALWFRRKGWLRF